MKICTVIGARPQFIKAAVVSRAIREYNLRCHPEAKPKDPLHEVIIHTGQHYDYEMSQVFFDQLEIPKPDHHLNVGSGLHGDQTGKMLAGIESILINEKPDWVLVYGDTNSTLAGALAASKLHIKVAHVEAGLRSFNRKMPEEINRVVTDHVSTILFAPTPTAVENLKNEGVVKGVHLVPDVMEEALFSSLAVAQERSQILNELDLTGKKYALSTIHRAENTDDLNRLREILSALAKISEEMPVVLPLHQRTKKIIAKEGLQSQFTNHQSLIIIDPVPYFDIIKLEANAKVILTDSGGMQKEAMWLKVPCITMRDETEWVETVENGWNKVAGASSDKILIAYQRSLQETHKVVELNNGITTEESGKTMLKILGSL